MKKAHILTIMLIILLVVTAFAGCAPDESAPTPVASIESKLIRNGLTLGEGCTATVIKSTAELEAFLVSLVRTDVVYFVDPFLFIRQFEKEHLAYGDEFFADNVLILGGWHSSSGSITYFVRSFSYYGEKILIGVDEYVPEIGTCDIVYWTMILEVPRTGFSGSEAEISFTAYSKLNCGNK